MKSPALLRASVIVLTAFYFVVIWALVRAGAFVGVKLIAPDFTLASRYAWSFLSFCLGIAGLTTALVQIARTLFPLRAEFHRDHLLRWFRRSNPSLLATNDGSSQAIARLMELLLGGEKFVSPDEAIKEFETKGMKTHSEISHYDNDATDLYDLPLEQLSAQLGLTVEAALDSPHRFPNFVLCTFGNDGVNELLLIIGREKRAPGNEINRTILEEAEARSTLTRLSQFKLDEFQITVGSKWRRSVRRAVTITAILCSLLVSSGSIWQSLEGLHRQERIYTLLLYSVFAGFAAAYIAMVMRDIVAIIENRRRRA